MALDITTPQIEWSEHDICYTVWILLNCSGRVRYDGAITDENDPDYTNVGLGQTPAVVGQCGTNSVTMNREINAAVVDTAPSGQTNNNVARRRVKPTVSGFTGQLLSGARVQPLVWALAGLASPIIDPTGDVAGTGPVIMGVEDPVISAAQCPTCGSAASCANELAVMTLHNAWCGEDPIPGWPYVALIQKSMDFEPTADSDSLGTGFGTGRTFSYTLRNNTEFIDPWGIHPAGALSGQNNKWSRMLISSARLAASVDPVWGLTDLINSCNCTACANP